MIDSVAGAKEKLKALAGAEASGGLFLSATLSTSRLDDWRQVAPAFLRSVFNGLTNVGGPLRDKKRLQTACSVVPRAG